MEYRAFGDGFAYRRIFPVNREQFEGLHEGDLVPIRYLPDDPRIGQVEGWEYDANKILSYGAALSVVGASCLMGSVCRGRATSASARGAA